MLAELFSFDIAILVLIFNGMAAGYIFYFAIQHERFPSPSIFGLSMVTFNILIFIFNVGYGKVVLINGYGGVLQKEVLYLVSNALVAPVFYLIVWIKTKNAIKKYQ